MREKRRFMRLFLLISVFLCGMQMFGQETTITGSVSDGANGELMPGVTVQIKGTTSGTVTSIDGDFSVKAKMGDVLVFSFIGYTSQEVSISDATPIKVSLQSETVGLDDVVVIGYGVQKKSDKTGAVSQVKASEMSGGVITDPMQAIAGKSAGVLVTKKGGDPNAGYTVKIRGASGFDAGTEPLYVIDGIVGADESAVAPEDIETFNVLKDAASAAIYGSQGSNGVIIITTKRGSADQQVASYSGLLSVEQVANKLPLLSASEVRDYAKKYNISMVDGGADTDWQDEVFQTGISQQHNVNFGGGNAKSTYYASLSYYDFEGVLKGTGKERTIGKVNVSHKALNDRLTLSGTLSGMFENNDYESYGGNGVNDVLYQAYTRNPTDPVYNADGSYYQSQREFNYVNPLSVIDNITNTREAKSFMGNIKGDLEITKQLIGSLNVAYTREDNASRYFVPKGYGTYGTLTPGTGTRAYNNGSQKVLEAILNYTNSFNEVHNLNAMLGYSWQEYNHDGFNATGRDAQSNYVGADNLSTLIDVNPGDISSYANMSRLIGFFGRVQYNYDSKYYLSGSLRRDGSTKFGVDSKWGIFPTVAGGWNLDREGFMEGARSWLDQLKLRASYGVSGNQNFAEYRSSVVWQRGQYATNPSTGLPTVTFTPSWNANPNLKWEETSEVNIGIDYAFFQSRLSGSLEVYSKKTDDLLGYYSVPVPPNLADNTAANSGSMTNKGIELFIKYTVIDKKNFKWNTSFNISHNQQEMVDLGEYAPADGVRKDGYLQGRGLIGNENWVTGIAEGHALGSFYLPVYRGLNSKGEMLFTSKSGGVTTDQSLAQREWVGNALPDAEIGWSNNMTLYKNFGIDFSFRALIGNDVYNATKMIFDAPSNIPNLNGFQEAVEWKAQGRTSGPKVADIYVEDGSFVRLDYLSFNYNVPLKNKTWFKSIKLIANANNLFVLTSYSGTDPETSIEGKSFGVDQYNVYPKTRAYSFGLNATF